MIILTNHNKEETLEIFKILKTYFFRNYKMSSIHNFILLKCAKCKKAFNNATNILIPTRNAMHK